NAPTRSPPLDGTLPNGTGSRTCRGPLRRLGHAIPEGSGEKTDSGSVRRGPGAVVGASTGGMIEPTITVVNSVLPHSGGGGGLPRYHPAISPPRSRALLRLRTGT